MKTIIIDGIEYNLTPRVLFKKGDWITNGDYTWKILEVKPLDYILQSQDGNIVDDTISHVDEQFHSFTIQDAKDGDVLAVEAIEENYQHPFVAIYKERGLDFFNSYCFIDFDGKFYEADTGHSTEKIHPATKEQRGLLFQKMHEAEYEWNAEKKELKKIEERPAEWSEKDEHCRQKAIDFMKHPDLIKATPTLAKDTIDWLKSLKDRHTWKPSDEQMFDLKCAADSNSNVLLGQSLLSLYNELKKLREE